MDVSGEGEPLWPVAQLPLSLFSLSLPLLSLVISLKLVPCPPFPFNFFSPLLSSQLPHTPPCFLSYLLFMSEAGDAARCTNDEDVLCLRQQ